MTRLSARRSFEEIWLEDHFDHHPLASLSLPDFSPSPKLLRAIVEKHPQLSYLSLGCVREGEGNDERAFEDNGIVSLHVTIHDISKTRTTMTKFLRSCKSLTTLRMAVPFTRDPCHHYAVFQDYAVLTNVKHLDIGLNISFDEATTILQTCPLLETAAFGPLCPKFGHGNVGDATLLPPHLRELRLKLHPEKNDGKPGLAQLLSLVSSLNSLTDLSIITSQWPNGSDHKCTPIQLCHPIPVTKMAAFTSFYTSIFERKHLNELRSLLKDLPHLQSLDVTYDLPSDDFDDGDNEEEAESEGKIKTLRLHVKNGCSISPLLRLWRSIDHLHWYSRRTGNVGVAYDLYQIVDSSSPDCRFQSLYSLTDRLVVPQHSFSALDPRLSCLKTHSLLRAQFEAGAFQRLVAATPMLETLDIGFGLGCPSDTPRNHGVVEGLSLVDVWRIVGWKQLRHCHMMVTVSADDVRLTDERDAVEATPDDADTRDVPKLKDPAASQRIREQAKAMKFLERMEVDGRMETWRWGLYSKRCPLIFGEKCEGVWRFVEPTRSVQRPGDTYGMASILM